MTRVYKVHKQIICDLLGQNCDEIPPPPCSDCPIYQEWKESGLTIQQWIKEGNTADEIPDRGW